MLEDSKCPRKGSGLTLDGATISDAPEEDCFDVIVERVDLVRSVHTQEPLRAQT